MLKVSTTGNWKLYWGAMPLPVGAETLGIIKRDTGTGALIKLASGQYVQGNAGGIRTLPQREVEDALAVSRAAAALGSIKSEAKARASRANASKPPKPGKRPRGRPKKK